MRPSARLLTIIILYLAVNILVYWGGRSKADTFRSMLPLYHVITASLGLTDICVSTEARYTRNPAVTDLTVPFMDHPGAIEHFPTGSFWAVPSRIKTIVNE